MAELLWEIGCEEMPATFVAPALAQLEELFRDKFTAARLLPSDSPVIGGEKASTDIQTYGTPRRLVLRATGLEERQPDETVQIKGPAQNIAFDAEGRPTRAAEGFARKNAVPVEELTVVDGYAQATVTRVGRTALEIAAELLPQIVRELTFPKAMRWGAGKLRFARPIRWILALLDNAVIPFAIEHVEAGRRTRGHRFLSPGEVDVPSIESYFALMLDKYVLIDPQERREAIARQTEQLAQEAGGRAEIPEALLEENVFLTEYPTAVLGSFDPDYLTLPRPVLVTAMRKHQRYFPVVAPGSSGLLPKFVAIRNGGDQYLATVRAGFERVLSARFNDARFFFDLDTQTPLSDKIEGTKKIVFQEKLGTVYEKSPRLGLILQNGGLLAGKTDAEASDLLRAAMLCKADLASEMVKELPMLQGIIGEEYARRDGETEAVAAAIAEHYQPRGAGDPLPASETGRCLAIADRVDTLTGYLGIGIVPTGTSDPYALRRAAAGLVALLATSPDRPSLRALFEAAMEAYAARQIPLTETPEAAYASFITLIGQRLDAALEEKNIRDDVREAVLSVPFENVFDVEDRAFAVQALLESPEAEDVLRASTRIGNILRFAAREDIPIPTAPPDPALFDHEAETALWNRWRQVEPEWSDAAQQRLWPTAFRLLAGLRPAVDLFFDSVMVMDSDPAKRDNRLALLAQLRQAYTVAADFDKIPSAS